jgi:Tol biopolymer transport system component
LGFGLAAGAAYDPGLHWYTIQTEHFSIDFPSRNLSNDDIGLARRFGQSAEQAYAQVAPLMKWRPRDRADVVIQDFYDYANGSTAPFPSNVITAIPTYPSDDLFSGGNWSRELMIHEFTHLEDMDMVHGLPRMLRWLFGRFSVPNAIQPVWGLEGLAVLNETRLTDFGRDRSPDFAMEERMAAIEDRFCSMDRATTYNYGRFPWGEAPYLYGGMFNEYLAERFGMDRVVEFHRDNSRLIPFFMDLAARNVFHHGLSELYSDWSMSAQVKAWDQVRAIKAQPLTRFRKVTSDGEFWSSPVFARDNSSVYCLRSDGSSFPALVRIGLGTGEQEVVRQDVINPDLMLSPDGSKLAFSKPDLIDGYYEFYDLYELDLGTGTLRRITTDMRAREPSVLSRDKSWVFVTNGKGRTHIMRLDSLGSLTELSNPEDNAQYAFPSLSADGRLLLAEVGRPENGSDICLTDLQSGWQFALTSDRARDMQPRWTPDGRYVVFSSDRSGVFNIYAYSIADRKLSQVTNVLGGAFAPSVSPDGRQLAFVSYSSKGNDIAVTGFDPATWTEARPFVDTLPRHEYTACPCSAQVERYNPVPSLTPKSWLPYVLTDGAAWNLGLLTLGADALYQHQFTFLGGYDTGTRWPFASLAYTNDQFLPTVKTALEVERQSQSLNLDAVFVDRHLLSQRSLSAGYEFLRDSARRLSGVSVQAAFSNAVSYAYSISPAHGQAANVFLSGYPKFLFSTGNMAAAGAGWQGFLSLPWRNHVLAVRGALEAAAGDDALARSLYGGGASGAFMLRGFPTDSLPSSRLLSLGVEYRFPMFRVEHGLGLFPVFLHTISGAGFIEGGSSWSGSMVPNLSALRADAGVGLAFNCTIGYLLPVAIHVGVAHGFRGQNRFTPYFNVSSSLLEELLPRQDRSGLPSLLQQVDNRVP